MRKDMDYQERRVLEAECGIENTKLPKEEVLREYITGLEEAMVRELTNPVLENMIKKAPENNGNVYDFDTISLGSSFIDSLKPKPSLLISDGQISLLSKIKSGYPGPFWDFNKFDFTPEIFNFADIISPESIVLNRQEISKGKDVGLFGLAMAIKQAHQKEREAFLKQIHGKGYVSNRDIPSLTQEVRLRHKQFPGSKIYIIVGKHLADYFDNLALHYVWEDSYILTSECGRYQHIINGEIVLPWWASAVISEKQIRTSHSMDFFYYLERVPRWWRINTCFVHKFTIEIDNPIKSVIPQCTPTNPKLHRFNF